jgi:Polysaccharide pyruvyl transferase.
MIFGGFEYRGLSNIGDYIQSIAAEQFLPEINIRLNRDSLSNYEGEVPVLLIMNGWFSHSPNTCFPPANQISGLYWGFHVTAWNNSWELIAKKESLAYLKRHEPIGCRDRYTAEKLKKNGIDSFYSKCLTLTFPNRLSEPEDGWNILVDAKHLPVPDHILKKSLFVSHEVPYNLPEKIKFIYARYLLNLYKEKARLVITTRLHCALPCIAMGIPVIFFGDENEYRVSLLKDIGLKIYDISLFKGGKNTDVKNVNYKNHNSILELDKVNWHPSPIAFEIEKREMRNKIERMIANKLNKLTLI